MNFQINAVDAPVAERTNTEYDALVPQVKELQQNGGQWAQLVVDKGTETQFRRKFREAANRAGYSAKFGKDTETDAGVSLTFTLQDKIERPRGETSADAEPETIPAAAPKPSGKSK